MTDDTTPEDPAPVDEVVPEIPDDLRSSMEPRLFDLDHSSHVLRLEERFIFPPFTQLDGRSGAWQDRKRRWLDLGLASAKGRTARTFAKAGNNDEVSQKILAMTDGQSIFDPVLCEMAYRWFCPPDGDILDPFAGGSVRGVVAAVTGRRYVGIDLSADQIAANYAQHDDFLERGVYTPDVAPLWIEGDSADMDELLEAEVGAPDEYDFVWSCPPYHDLEVYSTDPHDLSNMPWPKFCRFYGEIIGAAVDRLKDDRFCGFVVGEIRGKDGLYRHFVSETVNAFEKAGAAYYNEAFLVSPAGTLPLRAAKQFVTSRKLGRTHQTVLLFVKGDPRKATAQCQDMRAMSGALKAVRLTEENLEGVPDDDDLSGMGHG